MARWTRNELLLALNLYFETPFGKQHQSYPPIVELANALGRTPSAIGMKLCNFTSLDPIEAERGIRGLSGASRLDKEIWNEFQDDRERLVNELESLLEQQRGASSAGSSEARLAGESDQRPSTPTSVLGVVAQRRHQNFFRRVVLRSYGTQCCVTQNPIPDLLRASHIIPWTASVEQRLNPRNGLCLSATFDAAFDRGLLSLNNEYRIVLSPKLKQYETNPEVAATFHSREGDEINLPEKNLPDPMCLKWHRENIFIS